MASAEDYAAWIVNNADKKGTPEFETVANAYQAARSSGQEVAAPKAQGMSDETRATLLAAKPLDRGGRGIVGETLHQAGNFAAGAARGAGSIGATIMAPVDWAMDKMEGKGGHTLSSLITGEKPLTRNEQRRADMDAALRSLGNDTDSLAYGTGKLGTEVAGTLGVGGVLGNAARGVQALPTVGKFVPAGLPAALTTMGMDSQGGNVLSRLALRTGSGAATGAASAALIDPENAAAGGVIGAVLPNALKVAAKAGGAVSGAVRGINDAFRNPMAVAGKTMQRFGITPDDVANLSSAPTATGARTTLAEQIKSASGASGAARLQDALRLNPELSPAMETRIAENNAARVATLKDLAGEGGKLALAIENRGDVAKQLYRDAFENSGALTPSQLKAQAELLASGRIEKLMQSPAIQEAMRAARTNAENAGQVFKPEGSIEGPHNMKLAIDDMIRSPDTAAQAAKVRGLEKARDRLIDIIETLSPAYKDARTQYAVMSKPVNQMEVAADLLKSGTRDTGDIAGTPRLMAEQYLRPLGNESQLIKSATGRNLGGSLDNVMEPGQLSKLRAVGDELNKLAAVGRVGNGPGSATAGRFASTNLLERMGVPAGLAESPIAQTIMRPVQFAMKMAEPRINQTLLEIIHNPAMAREAMKAATPAERGAIMKALAVAAKQSPKAAGALAELTNNGE